MLGLSIKLNKSILTSQAYGLTSGTENVFEGVIKKSVDWDGYSISVVFTQGETKIPTVVVDDTFVVPTGSLNPGQCEIYVAGSKQEETLVSKISTVFIYKGYGEGIEVPKDIWIKYVEIMNEHLQTSIAVENNVKTTVEGFDEHCMDHLNSFNENASDKISIIDGKVTIVEGLKTDIENNIRTTVEELEEYYTDCINTFDENASNKISIIDGKIVVVEGLKNETSQLKEDVTELKNETSVLNDEVEVNATEVEENTITVRECKEIVEKAMHDMLSMMNDKIATLVDGKLNPDQIPDLAIGNVTWVDGVDKLEELTNQQIGDIVYVTEEGKGPEGDIVDAFINVGDQTDNQWRKLSTSFVANAGHANTASTSTNSMMINGKRMVAMTALDYAQSVKDDEVYYMVSDFNPEVTTAKVSRAMYDAMTTKNENVTYVVTEETE